MTSMEPHFPYLFSLFLLSFTILSCQPSSSLNHSGRYYQFNLPGVIGPESIAFDCHGKGPYVGVSDGRILMWQGAQFGWKHFAITSPQRKNEVCDGSTDPNMEPVCGRPLGLKFNPTTCDLYIADAYYGLFMAGPNGGVAKQLANSAAGIPFKCTNSLDIDSTTGHVYFTDSSTIFQRREFVKAMVEGDNTGRLMKYDPKTKNVTVLLPGLSVANGVALSKDKSFLLVAETGILQITRYWLKGPKSNTKEIFAQLQSWPDNIKMNSDGKFWVALNTGRAQIRNLEKNDDEDPVALKFDENGKILKILDGKGGGRFESVSEVEEHEGKLWVGSLIKSYLGVILE